MDFDRLCELLGGVDIRHLKEGFAGLLNLFPESSCEPVQLVNLLIPLVMEVLRQFYNDHTLVQMNLYLYVQVCSCFYVFLYISLFFLVFT